jgi:hypothetical protein
VFLLFLLCQCPCSTDHILPGGASPLGLFKVCVSSIEKGFGDKSDEVLEGVNIALPKKKIVTKNNEIKAR